MRGNPDGKDQREIPHLFAAAAEGAESIAAGTAAVRPQSEEPKDGVQRAGCVRKPGVVPAAPGAGRLLEWTLFHYLRFFFDFVIELVALFEFGFAVPILCHSSVLAQRASGQNLVLQEFLGSVGLNPTPGLTTGKRVYDFERRRTTVRRTYRRGARAVRRAGTGRWGRPTRGHRRSSRPAHTNRQSSRA